MPGLKFNSIGRQVVFAVFARSTRADACDEWTVRMKHAINNRAARRVSQCTDTLRLNQRRIRRIMAEYSVEKRNSVERVILCGLGWAVEITSGQGGSCNVTEMFRQHTRAPVLSDPRPQGFDA